MLLDEIIADQIAESFRAICIAAALDSPVEPLEQVGVDRNSDSAKSFCRLFWHNRFFIMSLSPPMRAPRLPDSVP